MYELKNTGVKEETQGDWPNENSVRDVVKDSIREDLANYYHIDISETDAELIGKIADGVFEALAIEENEQDFVRESGCFVWLQR